MSSFANLDPTALRQARIELAAACRWAGALGFQTGVCNHFSVLAPGSDEVMLVNPEGYFWSEVTASSIVLADLDGNTLEGSNTVELTAFNIHAPIHRLAPNAKAILHTHMPNATAICARTDGEVRPIYLSAINLYGSIGYDRNSFGAAVKTAEGERLADVLADNRILMMQNHGPIAIGRTIGEAFLRLIYLEDTCRIQILAEAGGAPLENLPAQLLAGRSPDHPMFRAYADTFMQAVVRKLSKAEPDLLD